MMRSLLVWCIALTLAAADVALASPLTTVVPLNQGIIGPRQVEVTVTVGADAPADLGIGVVVRDRDGRWFQVVAPQPLRPGKQTMVLTVRDTGGAEAHPLPASLRTADLERCDRTAVFVWSAQASTATVSIEGQVTPLAPTPSPVALHDLFLTGYDAASGHCRVACGERWELHVTPTPFPANPFDTDEFRLEAVISGPDGDRRVLGFADQAIAFSDGGDREIGERHGESRFALRFRPSLPGTYAIRLEATWGDGRQIVSELPPLEATGPAIDTLVRIDADDPRFFSVDNRFWWPVGLNLHSTYDLRSREVLATRLTPHRGTLVYESVFPRMAAAGIDCCEIWLSSWNLALEWRADWPGYDGIGRYSLGNAARIDRVFDAAWAHGIRINVVINNHGQASARTDREWKDNPWNSANGGPLATPEEVFTHPEVIAGQERLRRYLIARYADHPAVLGWKLWSEVDLTAGKGPPLERWFKQATARWRDLDTYGHTCTTHWAGTYARVDPAIAAIDHIGYLCIDAYRGASRDGGTWQPMTQLLANSLHDPARGLLRWNKPLLTTEYGASGRAPLLMRTVDLRVAAFAALVSGHGGSPMTWWWEWIDQNDLWASFVAVRRVVADDDLRGGRSVALAARHGEHRLWCRAWVNPGRVFGYVVDDVFASTGKEVAIASGSIDIGNQIEPGRMQVRWFHADTGLILVTQTMEHRGGPLTLSAPPFSGHLVFVLQRSPTDESESD